MQALKTLVIGPPRMAELFGLNVLFVLALLLFDADHFLRFVGLCLFILCISLCVRRWSLFVFHVMTCPVAVSNETSPRR